MRILILFCHLFLWSAIYAEGTTYKESGVDIAKGNQLITQIAPFVRATARPGAEAQLGGFGALFDLSKIDYKDPLLISTTDGVGTKLKLAISAQKFDSLGTDLVAMCVNDLLAQGAEPLFFLDYFATSTLGQNSTIELICGIADACKMSQCALVGGETAEMPGVYRKGEFDIAGFSVGIVEREHLLPKIDQIKAGDVIIGVASSGLHSNGFSLVRKVLEDKCIDLAEPPLFFSQHTSLYEALLEPTKIYVSAVLPLVKEQKLKAIAHITGGGLQENISRVIPRHLRASLCCNKWYIQPVFRWIKEVGQIENQEMFKVFNMGVGLVLIASKTEGSSLLNALDRAGLSASIIGVMTEKKEGEEDVYIKGEIPNSSLRVMVVGRGGREHALAWKCAQSEFVESVYVAPGNAGTLGEAKMINVASETMSIEELVQYAQERSIDLTIVGPETALAEGIVDAFTQKGLRCFGPNKSAAQLEASKAFSKNFMKRHNLPTAKYDVCTTLEEVREALSAYSFPVVIKADGLAQGKGVIIAENAKHAMQAAREMPTGSRFDEAGKTVVVEEFLEGEELSFIVITDWLHNYPLGHFPRS